MGAKAGDDMSGGAGNDTLVWNNGDGSDFIKGEAGNDATEVNGNPTTGARPLRATSADVVFALVRMRTRKPW